MTNARPYDLEAMTIVDLVYLIKTRPDLEKLINAEIRKRNEDTEFRP